MGKPKDITPTTGFIVIATRKYKIFIDDLIDSMIRYYTSPFTIYLFTDIEYPYHRNRVVNKIIKHEPWPLVTLNRYKTILSQTYNTDYLFYIDVDMVLRNCFSIDDIKGHLVGTLHPGYWASLNKPHCRDSRSSAYCNNGKEYYCGGFQGGKTANYLSAAKLLDFRIEIDKANMIMAPWHDESHWNKLLADNPPDKTLKPQFCFVKGYGLQDSPMIEALDKDHKEMRAE